MGSTILPASEYATRHNKVVGYIHWTICKRMRLQYYEHVPERAIKYKRCHFYVARTGCHRSSDTNKQN